ncbi:hypothetical protein EJ08DRAFT_656091 [Tothia fuscella]|uniref:Rad51-like C-terminal domain-containing protein n=1 Tax=Tothia fuscella TaxID=1048955 RepID=A0A9P4U2F5_9PEZI|nr:hypothetical protein EJ08DRAFT_656091 [Tothia fuscella]
MSAEDLGKRLLGECSGVRMDGLLKSLRTLDSQTHNVNHFNLAPLDQLLHSTEMTTNDVSRKLPLKPVVIELCSAESGVGKTHLLYMITILAILPSIYHDVILEGPESTVIIIDTEGRFSIERLAQIMENYITEVNGELPNLEELVAQSLDHVHIFRPQTMAAMTAILFSLPKYLFDTQARESTRRPLHSVIVDSASTFYWQNREDEEAVKLANLDDHNGPAVGITYPYSTFTQSLRSLCFTFSCAIVVTTHAVSSINKETGQQVIRTLPAPWSTFPSLRLLLSRQIIQKFAHGISIEEALKEQIGRQSLVEKVKYHAKVVGSTQGFRLSIQGDNVVVGED